MRCRCLVGRRTPALARLGTGYRLELDAPPTSYPALLPTIQLYSTTIYLPPPSLQIVNQIAHMSRTDRRGTSVCHGFGWGLLVVSIRQEPLQGHRAPFKLGGPRSRCVLELDPKFARFARAATRQEVEPHSLPDGEKSVRSGVASNWSVSLSIHSRTLTRAATLAPNDRDSHSLVRCQIAHCEGTLPWPGVGDLGACIDPRPIERELQYSHAARGERRESRLLFGAACPNCL